MSSSFAILLVDDFDTNRIQYVDGSEQWDVAGVFYEHSSTTHGLSPPGSASFQFAFNGTEVSAYGTLPAGNALSAAIDCTVDDGGNTQHFQQKIATDAPTYNVQYCNFTGLSDDKEHTLHVSVNASTNFFYLDYILYKFPMDPNSSLNAVPPGAFANVVVDDTSVAISYGGSWTNGGSLEEYNSTTHDSSADQANATIQFNGVGIQVYGTMGPDQTATGQTASTYAIDNGIMATQEKYTQLGSEVTAKQLLLYGSPTLEAENHILTIEVNAPQGKPLYVLDFIVYTASPTFGIFSESTSPLPAPVPTSSGSSDENQSPTDNASVTKIIIPVVIVPVILLILCFILGLRYRKQRKRKSLARASSQTPRQSFTQSSTLTSDFQVLSCPPHHRSMKVAPDASRSLPSYDDDEEVISSTGGSSMVNSESQSTASPPPEYYSAC